MKIILRWCESLGGPIPFNREVTDGFSTWWEISNDNINWVKFVY